MNVTWPGHAQLFVNAANKTLLIDPWFAEPVFAGAWFRYPPSPFADSSMFPMPDFLMISHTHPDHAGLETLLQMQKGVRVLAVNFASGAMKRRLERAGLHNVQWAQPWQRTEIAPELHVTFVPHHAGWEVASMIVEADGVRLYHGNDNPLSIAAYQEIVTRLGPIDLAFLPYAGASSYPTGFDGDAQTMQARCEAKKREGLARFQEGLQGLRPAEAVPFASSWALLEAGEIEKNFVDRFTANEVLIAAISVANEAGTKLLHMEPGDEWTAEAGVIRKELTREWPNDVASIRRYAEQERTRVDAAVASRAFDVPANIEVAFERYLRAMTDATRELTAGLKMKVGFKVGESGFRIAFEPGHAPEIARGLTGDEHEVLSAKINELAMIVFGPLTWEDVWYGYRLRVAKRAGSDYAAPFWDMLLGFDGEAISSKLRAELGS